MLTLINFKLIWKSFYKIFFPKTFLSFFFQSYIGGIKVLVAGPWYNDPNSNNHYSILFDSIPVQTELIQNGLLRCFSPKHQSGLITLQVSCNNIIISNSVIFEYRDSNNNNNNNQSNNNNNKLLNQMDLLNQNSLKFNSTTTTTTSSSSSGQNSTSSIIKIKQPSLMV